MMYHVSIGAVVSPVDQPHSVLLLYRKKTDTYHLPKGTMEDGESFQKTIIREVQEEAGIHITPQTIFADTQSSFVKDQSVVIKKTFYVRATSISTSIVCADNEHDSGSWYHVDDAIIQLSTHGGHIHLGYENEVLILQQYNQLYVTKECD